MQHQQDIGLRAEQRAAITKGDPGFPGQSGGPAVAHARKQSQRLASLLEKAGRRSGAALAQVDEVLSVEREVKRAHITLLINIKNTLSAEQQAKLAAARGAAMR